MPVRAGEDRAVAVEGVAVLELGRLEEHRGAVAGCQRSTRSLWMSLHRTEPSSGARPGPRTSRRRSRGDGGRRPGRRSDSKRGSSTIGCHACDGGAVGRRRASQARLEQLEPLEVGAQGRGAGEPDRPEPEGSRPVDVARLVVDEHRLPGHHAVAVDQRLEHGGLRLRRADLARHHDPPEPARGTGTAPARSGTSPPTSWSGRTGRRRRRGARRGGRRSPRSGRPASRPSARGRRGSGPRARGGSRRARRRRRPRNARDPARGSTGRRDLGEEPLQLVRVVDQRPVRGTAGSSRSGPRRGRTRRSSAASVVYGRVDHRPPAEDPWTETRCSPRCATSPPRSTPTTSTGSWGTSPTMPSSIRRAAGPSRHALRGHSRRPRGLRKAVRRHPRRPLPGGRALRRRGPRGLRVDAVRHDDRRPGDRGPRLRPVDVPRREDRQEGQLLEDPDGGTGHLTDPVRPARFGPPSRPAARGPPLPPRRRR